jgi:hypothetical protein
MMISWPWLAVLIRVSRYADNAFVYAKFVLPITMLIDVLFFIGILKNILSVFSAVVQWEYPVRTGVYLFADSLGIQKKNRLLTIFQKLIPKRYNLRIGFII